VLPMLGRYAPCAWVRAALARVSLQRLGGACDGDGDGIPSKKRETYCEEK